MESATIYPKQLVGYFRRQPIERGSSSSERVGLVLVSFLTDLIGAGNDARELVLLFLLAFHHGLENRRVVGSQIDEDMGDAALINVSDVCLITQFQVPYLPKSFEKSKRCCINPGRLSVEDS